MADQHETELASIVEHAAAAIEDPTEALLLLDVVAPGAGTALKYGAKLAGKLAKNDRRVSAAFAAQLQAMTLEHAGTIDELADVMNLIARIILDYERWAGRPEEERPTAEDVTSATEAFARAAYRAGGHGKRRVLWNAFFSRFDPRFYERGMSTTLWRLAEQLEYPDATCLRDLLERRLQSREFHQLQSDKPSFSSGRKLVDLGLCVKTGNHPGVLELRPTGMGELLREFIWDRGPEEDAPVDMAVEGGAVSGSGTTGGTVADG